MMPVAVIVVRIPSGTRLRRDRTLLLFRGFEHESKNSGAKYKHGSYNCNLHH